MTAARKVIRADGSEIPLPHAQDIAAIQRLIGADTLDIVQLRHLGAPRAVMFVDDVGHAKGLPVNPKATELYLANCRPGTTHQIRGDVAIVFDEDFGGPL